MRQVQTPSEFYKFGHISNSYLIKYSYMLLVKMLTLSLNANGIVET